MLTLSVMRVDRCIEFLEFLLWSKQYIVDHAKNIDFLNLIRQHPVIVIEHCWLSSRKQDAQVTAVVWM